MSDNNQNANNFNNMFSSNFLMNNFINKALGEGMSEVFKGSYTYKTFIGIIILYILKGSEKVLNEFIEELYKNNKDKIPALTYFLMNKIYYYYSYLSSFFTFNRKYIEDNTENIIEDSEPIDVTTSIYINMDLNYDIIQTIIDFCIQNGEYKINSNYDYSVPNLHDINHDKLYSYLYAQINDFQVECTDLIKVRGKDINKLDKNGYSIGSGGRVYRISEITMKDVEDIIDNIENTLDLKNNKIYEFYCSHDNFKNNFSLSYVNSYYVSGIQELSTFVVYSIINEINKIDLSKTDIFIKLRILLDLFVFANIPTKQYLENNVLYFKYFKIVFDCNIKDYLKKHNKKNIQPMQRIDAMNIILNLEYYNQNNRINFGAFSYSFHSYKETLKSNNLCSPNEFNASFLKWRDEICGGLDKIIEFHEKFKINTPIFPDIKLDSNSKKEYSYKDKLHLLVQSQVYNEIELKEHFDNWFNYIVSESKKKEDDCEFVQTFIVKIVENKKVNYIDNPNYEEFVTFERNENNEIKKDLEGNNIIRNVEGNGQPKKLKEIEIEYETKIEEMNKFIKPLETLYLPEHSERIIKSRLRLFKHKTDKLKQHGLQKKLCMLLHGAPGTGKSSTIKAVASYLHMNVYYIGLNNIKSDKQLIDIFKRIEKISANSGIIVFEDIDAMTDVVIDRKDNESDDSLTSFLNKDNNELTLSCILNILDGSLTSDNMVVIITTNYKERLDDALIRDGRIDVNIEFELCDHYQFKRIYHDFIERDLDDEILKRISEYKFTPSTIINHLVNYIDDIETSDEDILEPFFNNEDLTRVFNANKTINNNDQSSEESLEIIDQFEN